MMKYIHPYPKLCNIVGFNWLLYSQLYTVVFHVLYIKCSQITMHVVILMWIGLSSLSFVVTFLYNSLVVYFLKFHNVKSMIKNWWMEMLCNVPLSSHLIANEQRTKYWINTVNKICPHMFEWWYKYLRSQESFYFKY